MFFEEQVWDVVLREGYGSYEADGAAADDHNGIHVWTLYFTPGYYQVETNIALWCGVVVGLLSSSRGWSSIAILGCGSVLKVYR